MDSSHLELFDGFSSFANDEAGFSRRNDHLLHVAAPIGLMEGGGRGAPPPRHDVIQHHLGLSKDEFKLEGKASRKGVLFVV